MFLFRQKSILLHQYIQNIIDGDQIENMRLTKKVQHILASLFQ